jgi:hypothetical protein
MKPYQKLSQKDGTQVALFPLENMRITQGVDDSYSHDDAMALDLSTLKVWDRAYAPFDCTVVYKTRRFNAVLFQSNQPVLCADGTKSIVVLAMFHDNDISDLVVGKKFLQGDKIYDEGGANYSGTPNVFASHIHLTVSKTPYEKGTNPIAKNEKGDWELANEVHPADVLFINDTNIINDLGYQWKIYIPPVITELKVGDKVWIKKTAIRYATGQLIPPEYKRGGKYAQRPFTLSFDGDKSLRWLVHGAWLLQELRSWVKDEDLEKA